MPTVLTDYIHAVVAHSILRYCNWNKIKLGQVYHNEGVLRTICFKCGILVYSQYCLLQRIPPLQWGVSRQVCGSLLRKI